MGARVKLLVEFNTAPDAEMMLSVLTPDNVRLPKGMELTLSRSASSLEVQASADDAQSLFFTVDGVLADMQLSQSILKEVLDGG